jgi:hypothetical protein
VENQFLLIIKKQDEGNFYSFKNGIFNKATEDILKKNDATYVWGIHKGIINKTNWNRIKKNDILYLTIEKENFKVKGILSKTSKDLKLGESVYPESIDKKQINYFLFFKKLTFCNISYSELINNSTSIIRTQGIFEIKKKYFSEKIKKYTPKKFNPKEKIIGPAKRSKSEVWRFVRNQGKVLNLKNLYRNKCQICNYTFDHNANQKKGFYSEVHHYNPLKKQADDDYGNMIVLCPNHHAEFDYGVKFIHLDEATIIDRCGKVTGEKISFHKTHKLDKKNLESQLE